MSLYHGAAGDITLGDVPERMMFGYVLLVLAAVVWGFDSGAIEAAREDKK